jgi:hypothetical protein
MAGISEATQLTAGFFAIISTIIGAVVALWKTLKAIKKAVKEPIERIYDSVELLNVKTDINIAYHKQDGNGYSKFYDDQLRRYYDELQLKKAIEGKRPEE